MNEILDRLTALFGARAPSAGGDGVDEVAVAVGALMVRLARADGTFDEAERARISAALDARFGGGAKALAAAELAEQEALDHHQFTKRLKAAYPPEDRGALIEELWSVVLADDHRDMSEDALMRQFSALLYVPEREVAEARQRVQARQRPEPG